MSKETDFHQTNQKCREYNSSSQSNEEFKKPHQRGREDNPAAALVTQVPQGATKPLVNLGQQQNLIRCKEYIVVGPQRKRGVKSLILDLDETLVHSSFQPVANCDLVLPVDIEGQTCYTSLSKYANPLLDWLDPRGLCDYRLFREHCTFHKGIFVKDLSRLDRPLQDTIIIDNSPASYMFHPECAIPTTSWYSDCTCTELYQFIPILECLSKVNDVRKFIKLFVKEDRVSFAKASQVLRGGKVAERANSQQRISSREMTEKEKKKQKQRTASEKRHQKNVSNPSNPSSLSQENYNSLKHNSKYSSKYKSETKESHSIKHYSPKLDGQVQKQYSRINSNKEQSTDAIASHKSYMLRNSTNSSNINKESDTQQRASTRSGYANSRAINERPNDSNNYRKRESSQKRKKKSSKTRQRSLQKQPSKEDLTYSPKDSEANLRYQEQKDDRENDQNMNNKYNNNFVYNTNCDYKKPEEFHKLRHSYSSNLESKRRPSSAKRKESPTCDTNAESNVRHEYSRNSQTRKSNRSRSKKETSKVEVNDNSSILGARNLNKAKSSANFEIQNDISSSHYTPNVKFNNLLKDISAHNGVAQSSGFQITLERSKNKDKDDWNKREDREYKPMKYFTNIESTLKAKEGEQSQKSDSYMMGSNVNHHYMLVHNSARIYFNNQSNNDTSVNQQKEAFSYSKSSNYKGGNPVIGVSSPIYTSNCSNQNNDDSNYCFENPAIPFPSSLRYPPSSFPTSNREFKPSGLTCSIGQSTKYSDEEYEKVSKFSKTVKEQKYSSYLDKF